MTGKELRRIRQKLGFTQTKFAERLRISRVSVNRMEYGNQVITPSMALLIELLTKEIRSERAGERSADTPRHEGKGLGDSSHLRLRGRKQQDAKKNPQRRGSNKA